jgi:hypothetical protein
MDMAALMARSSPPQAKDAPIREVSVRDVDGVKGILTRLAARAQE